MTSGGVDWDLARARLQRARQALVEVHSPEDERRVLAERAHALARPPAASPDGDGEPVDVVVFSLCGVYFAVAADRVLEAVPLGEPTPVPGTPDWLLGVINHRGKVLGVLDLRRQLVPGAPWLAGPAHSVVVTVDEMTFGIAAETVEETARRSAGELERSLVTLVDLEALAADPRLRIDDA